MVCLLELRFWRLRASTLAVAVRFALRTALSTWALCLRRAIRTSRLNRQAHGLSALFRGASQSTVFTRCPLERTRACGLGCWKRMSGCRAPDLGWRFIRDACAADVSWRPSSIGCTVWALSVVLFFWGIWHKKAALEAAVFVWLRGQDLTRSRRSPFRLW